MSEFIETARAKSGQRVSIRISEIATITECAMDTSCIVTRRGEAYHVTPNFDDLMQKVYKSEKKEKSRSLKAAVPNDRVFSHRHHREYFAPGGYLG